ncbi:UNVERIFIED_ORG: hypothetical protein J2W60_003271 [Stenotrophomonas maltophilia]|nr:hypothetical protein [Stenotrophomonas maltophilia]
MSIGWIAVAETAGRILPAMLPSHGYQSFRTAPMPAGWVQLGDTLVLWWNGRQIVNVSPACGGSVRVRVNAWKMWNTKDVRAASIAQGKRYAERWCAARLYPEMRLRAAVARLLDTTSSEPLEPLPGLPPTLEQQQQARRLAEATAAATARVKEALEPPKPPTAKPRPKDAREAWVSAGLQQLRRGV